MKNRIIQLESSTTGLLTAIAVFVGLLLYATYFAFDNNTSEVTTEVESEDIIAIETPSSIIAPLASGIFESETLAVNEQVVALNPAQRQQPVVNVDPEVVVIEAQQQAPQNYNETGNTENIDRGLQSAYPEYGPGDQLSLMNSDQYQARLANQHYYNSWSNGRGQGKGRGHFDSDGEFNFSFKFKSRARMDADANADRQLYSHLNTQNNAYNRNWNAINPAYHYSYRQY